MSTKTAKTKVVKTASKNNKAKTAVVEASATTPVVAKAKSNRIEYGFELNFPAKPFTVKQLASIHHDKVKYITLYVRVQNALKKGILTEVGKRVPSVKRKGRQEIIYQRANVTAGVTTPEPIAEVAQTVETPVIESTPVVVEAPVTAETAPVIA